MANCSPSDFHFHSFDRRKIEVSFEGGDVSSDGGLLLVRQMDARLGLIRDLSQAVPDDRHPSFITHSEEELFRQRVLGLVQGYEDLSDHDTLRHDLLRQTAVNRDTPLASSPTLCRLEKRANHQSALAIHKVFLDEFIAYFKEAPTELPLDFDATDDRVRGDQEGRFFHGYSGTTASCPCLSSATTNFW